MLKIELKDDITEDEISVEHHMSGSVIMKGSEEVLTTELGYLFHSIMSQYEHGYELLYGAFEKAIEMAKHGVK